MPASLVSRTGSVVALAILLSASLFFRHFRDSIERPHPGTVAIDTIPMTIGDWKGRDAGGLGIVPRDILRLDRYIRRLYTNSKGDEVFVYIGYWSKQSGEHQAAKHSPAICLPSNGWAIDKLGREKITLAGEPLTINRLIGNFNHQRQFFHYWFFSGERTYSEEWFALLNIVLETYFHGRSDGGIVELAATIKGGDQTGEKSEKALREFEEVLYPVLRSLITEHRNDPATGR